MEYFSDWLNSEMNTRGWSQADLSRATGISRSGVSNLVNGRRNAGTEACNAIAKAFEMPAEIILRKAGLLESKPSQNITPTMEEFNHLLSQMTEQEQKELLAYARFFYQQQQQRETREDTRPRPRTSGSVA